MKIYVIVVQKQGMWNEELLNHTVTTDEKEALQIMKDMTYKVIENNKINAQIHKICDKEFKGKYSNKRFEREKQLEKELGLHDLKENDFKFECIEVWENLVKIETIHTYYYGEIHRLKQV